MADPNVLRQTFDEVASLYHQARPTYPNELFSTLLDVVRLDPQATLLEIGPGTGQATIPLAQKGFQITAVELGKALTQVAKQVLIEYPNVQFVNASFEEAPLPVQSFDLVYAATSFHWIEPAVKYAKPYQLLKDKGHLAIIHTNHISDEVGDAFFRASQPIYDRYDYTDKHQKPSLPKNSELKPDILDSDLFQLLHFQCFPLVITYPAKEYANLLNTFSNHLASDKMKQLAFYQAIEALINEQFSGSIDKHFSISLLIAQKRES